MKKVFRLELSERQAGKVEHDVPKQSLFLQKQAKEAMNIIKLGFNILYLDSRRISIFINGSMETLPNVDIRIFSKCRRHLWLTFTTVSVPTKHIAKLFFPEILIYSNRLYSTFHPFPNLQLS